MGRCSMSAVVILISIFTNGQVGINIPTPESTLDVRAKNHLGPVSSTDDVLVPRVNDLSVNGKLVYLLSNSGSLIKGFNTGTELHGRLFKDTTNDSWINDATD